MGATAMNETAKEGMRRLAGFILAKGYQPEALHEYTDQHGLSLFFRMRLKHPVTGEKCILPMKLTDGTWVFILALYIIIETFLVLKKQKRALSFNYREIPTTYFFNFLLLHYAKQRNGRASSPTHP